MAEILIDYIEIDLDDVHIGKIVRSVYKETIEVTAYMLVAHYLLHNYRLLNSGVFPSRLLSLVNLLQMNLSFAYEGPFYFLDLSDIDRMIYHCGF